jgi:hypothetical protein
MKKARKPSQRDTMRREYDFSAGVRGKYAARFQDGANIVILEPDVAAVFTDSAAVNKALRAIIEIAPSRPARRKRTA